MKVKSNVDMESDEKLMVQNTKNVYDIIFESSIAEVDSDDDISPKSSSLDISEYDLVFFYPKSQKNLPIEKSN